MKKDIIDRIQKLLALATSPNEHEAAQAAAKAQALLMQYNLSLEDVKSAERKANLIELEEIENHRRKVHWKGNLAVTIAKANFCQAWWTGGQITLAGKPHNRAIVKSLYDYLTSAIERLATEAVKVQKQNYQMYLDQIAGTGIAPFAQPNWRTWKSSFIVGCTSRLCDRIREQTKCMQTEGIPDANVTGLACRQAYEREFDEISRSLRECGISLHRVSGSRSRVTKDGYTAGQRAANSISLNRQVSPASNTRLLR